MWKESREVARVGGSERPRIGARMYHIGLAPGEMPELVLLPGDPGRIDLIKEFWSNPVDLAYNREYRSAKGLYKDIEVGALSTGIGGPSTAIAVEELAEIGARVLLRVGTCGALSRETSIGTLIIATGAVRFDGTSHDYAPPEYPAVADPHLVLALEEAARKLGYRHEVGIVATTSSFHLGQSRPGYKGYEWSLSRSRIVELRRMGVKCFEMESATLLTIASIYGLRAACICSAIANRETGEFKPGAGVREAVHVANEALYLLAKRRSSGLG